MLGSIQSYVIVTLVVTMFIMSTSAYVYFRYTQSEIATLRENATKLEQAVQTQQAALAAQQQAHDRSNREIQSLQTRLQDAEQVRRDLETRLRRLNLEAAARRNAQETEQRLNRGTQTMFSEIERITQPRQGVSSVASASPGTVVPTPNPNPTPSVRTSSDPQPPPRPPVRNSP